MSKLRYLEEQGLVMPRRTKAGYRLYSQDDFNRLVRVLTMQRDEYLPLKVIRRELERSPAAAAPAARQGLRKADFVVPGEERTYTAEEVQQLTGADPALLDELEEYELVRSRQVSGVRRYGETECGIVGRRRPARRERSAAQEPAPDQERHRPRDRPRRAGAAAGAASRAAPNAAARASTSSRTSCRRPRSCASSC